MEPAQTIQHDHDGHTRDAVDPVNPNNPASDAESIADARTLLREPEDPSASASLLRRAIAELAEDEVPERAGLARTRSPDEQLALARTFTPPPEGARRVSAPSSARRPRPLDPQSREFALSDTRHSDVDASADFNVGLRDTQATSPDHELGLRDTQASASHHGLAVSDTIASNSAHPGFAAAAGTEDPRIKSLIRAQLFKNKAAPVKIGRFTVIGRLGEGGMGVVYAAYDDQLDRKVAIKVLRSRSRETSTGHARLLREAQAMARLSHPNIVTVHEVGELADDQVFVAMEFVRGQTLQGWHEAADRSWREILEVYRQAGRGLQAAHDAQLVHRDFKPHNALVGDDGVVKVLDFGLARGTGEEAAGALTEGAAADGDATTPRSILDATLTRTGAIMGTPAYMSPEQHEGKPAGPASDQFSFCVSLYEALYERHPYNCDSLLELVKSVTEGARVDPPSSAHVPAWLHRVVVRGLAVKPEDRHPSMAALVDALDRDPARARRRWLSVAGIAGLAAASSFGIARVSAETIETCPDAQLELAGVWDDEGRDRVRAALLATEVPFAESTWEKIGPRLDSYAASWVDGRDEACATHLAERQSDALFDLRSACLDQRREGLDALVKGLGELTPDAVMNVPTAVASLPSISRCADTQALTAAVPPPEDAALANAVDEARIELARARSRSSLGAFEDALAIVERVSASEESRRYPPLLADAKLLDGATRTDMFVFDAADQSLERALLVALAHEHDEVAAEAIARRVFTLTRTKSPEEALALAPLASAFAERLGQRGDATQGTLLNNLGDAYQASGDLARAREHYRRSIETKRRALGPNHPEVGFTTANLGTLEQEALRLGAAVENYERALTIFASAFGETHPYYAIVLNNLSFTHLNRGEFEAARDTITRARDVIAAALGPEAPLMDHILQTMGALALAEREYPAARQHFTRSLALLERLGASEGMESANSRHGLADALAGSGELERARAEHTRALSLRVKQAGEDAAEVSFSRLRLGDFELELGQLDAAAAHYRASLTIRAELSPKDAPSVAEVHERLGRLALRQRDLPSAREELTRAHELLSAALPPNNPHVVRALRSLAQLELAEGSPERALARLQDVKARYAAVRDAGDPLLALVDFDIARALAGLGRRAEAEEAARAAIAALAELPGYARERGELQALAANGFVPKDIPAPADASTDEPD